MILKNRLLVIIGTKAQLIKMAPVMAELKRRKIDYDFLWTGQHRETIDEIIDNFGIKKPDGSLYEGKEVKSLAHGIIWMLGLMLKSMVAPKNRDKGIALVHGDAVSALIGMMYGRSRGYKIGTVEAGLRSFNLFKPFPEEIVRIIVSHFTDYHFAPGDWAAGNLKKRRGQVINTELNTLYDSLRIAVRPRKKAEEKYTVVNLHRFENIQDRKKLKMLVEVIGEISKKIKVIFILHPATKYQLEKFDLLKRLQSEKNIEMMPRQDYITFINLVINSDFMVTDGGSNQEETSYYGHPCLILRSETERREGLGGNAILSSFNREVILDFANNYEAYRRPPIELQKSPSKLIVDFLSTKL